MLLDPHARPVARLGDDAPCLVAPVPRVGDAPTRFVALPLRVLRPDAETDFLAFSVPDAVSIALAPLQSVIVLLVLAATTAG